MIESYQEFLAGQSVEWLREQSKRFADQIERFAAVGVVPRSGAAVRAHQRAISARDAVDAEIARRDPEGELPF